MAGDACDPGAVFLQVAHVVRVARTRALPFEPLAANLVERYLAEYRGLLRSDEAYRKAVLDVLDTFVQAGWPAATL